VVEFVTSSVAVFEAAIDTGKINAYDEIVIQNQKKKYGNLIIFLHKSLSKRWFRNGTTAC